MPTITPWKTTSPGQHSQLDPGAQLRTASGSTPKGNQLPYIDKINLGLGENLEVINLRAIAGEIRHADRHMDTMKIPVLLENQQKGNYKVSLNRMGNGSDIGLYFNLDYDADPKSTNGSTTSTSAAPSPWLSSVTRSTRPSSWAPAYPGLRADGDESLQPRPGVPEALATATDLKQANELLG